MPKSSEANLLSACCATLANIASCWSKVAPISLTIPKPAIKAMMPKPKKNDVFVLDGKVNVSTTSTEISGVETTAILAITNNARDSKTCFFSAVSDQT